MGKTTRRWISLGNGPDSISIAWKAPVLAVASAPASSNDSDRFIVGASPSGDFAAAPVNSIATRFDGGWWFEVCAAGDAVIDLGTGKLLAFSGTAWEDKGAIIGGSGVDTSLLKWRDPVGAIVDALPMVCSAGDRVILSTDNKIYTATAANTWGAGVAPEASWTLVCAATDKIYVYDDDGDAWVVIGGGGATPDATSTTKGIVSVPDGSGLTVTDGALSLARRTVRERFTLSSDDINAKGVDLAGTVLDGHEAVTQLNIVGGVFCSYGVDYTISGQSISWDGLGLDGVLEASDVIDVTYVTEA